MKQWMQQISPKWKKCARCHTGIEPFTLYFRAVAEPDGLDETGYDMCAKCQKEYESARKKTGNPPG